MRSAHQQRMAKIIGQLSELAHKTLPVCFSISAAKLPVLICIKLQGNLPAILHLCLGRRMAKPLRVRVVLGSNATLSSEHCTWSLVTGSPEKSGHYVMSSYTEPHPDKARDQPFYRARNRSSVIVHCKTGFNGNGNRDIPHSNADRRFRQRWDDTAGVVLGQFRDSAANTRPRLGSCKPSGCLNRLTRDFTRRRETLPSGPSEPRRSSSPSTSRHGRRLANTAAPSIPSFLNRQSCRGK